MNSLLRPLSALLLGSVPLLASTLAVAAPSATFADIQFDVPAAGASSASPATSASASATAAPPAPASAAPVPPTPPPAVQPPAREQPPTPASPHTEYQPAPPTEDQADQWPVVAKGKETAPRYPAIKPYASIVGGVSVDVPIQYQIGTQAASNMADRVSTIMMSDFGVRGALLPWISFESELMANAGIALHGSSAFEGQASLQVRKQVIHLARDWWMVEVGRIVDEASVDYFSYHIADCFLMDPATEPFLLFDGFNLGNGVRGTAEIFPGMRLGFTFNAGTPVSSSALVTFGGSLPGSTSIFGVSAGSVQNDPNNYPSDASQAYTFTPSAMYKNKYFEAKTELQYFAVNIDADDGKAPILTGYNYRANAMAHIWDDRIMPFLNFNYGENATFSATDVVSPNRYVQVGIGGGIDINYEKKWGNYNGVGAMFVQDESEVGSNSIITRNRYYNVGTTYWLAPMLAAGLRFAEYTTEQLNQPPSTNPTPSQGVRSVVATLRLVL